MNTKFKNVLARVVVILVPSLLILTNCTEDNATTLKSPVQAVTTVFEKEDGTVLAELYLISTTDDENHVFVKRDLM